VKEVIVLPGDGIGPEVIESALKILDLLIKKESLSLSIVMDSVGGDAIDRYGVPIRKETIQKIQRIGQVVLGAVGGPKWDTVPFELRPEKALLTIRKTLQVYANLRPIRTYEPALPFSPLKEEICKGVDMVIVRELVGGIYFGEPRGIRVHKEGKVGINTEIYSEREIERVARVAFSLAKSRKKKVTSVDKANVLESSALWREVVQRVSGDFPGIQLHHLYVDTMAMQIVQKPGEFDVILTNNLFGDILSDEGAVIAGSIGLLPSASIGDGTGFYEPIHGSAPDIAGKGIANPIGTILSFGWFLELSLNRPDLKRKIENAVEKTLMEGIFTPDLKGNAKTEEVTSAIIKFLSQGT